MQNSMIRTPTPMRVVLRTGDRTHVARFQELVRCDFPLYGWEPIAVEIPPEGHRSHFGRPPRADHPLRDLSTVLHLPRYLDGEDADEKPGASSSSHLDDRSRLLAATPILGVATRTDHAPEDGLRTRSAAVLLAWASGTSVVVTLDLAEGTSPDGELNEWHLRASQGLSLARGFEVLERESQPATGRGSCIMQSLHVAPGALGLDPLGGEATNTHAAPWTHEWHCENTEDLRGRLTRLAGCLSGLSVEIQ